MTDYSCHPAVLRLLGAGYRGRRLAARVLSRLRRDTGARSDFYRRAWGDAAAALGAEVTPAGGDALEIRLGGCTVRVCNNRTPLDDAATLRRAGDKPEVYRLLREAGLPVLPHREFTLARVGEALDFLRRAGTECVIKPAFGTGAGQGVTTGIRTPAQLARAAAAAAAYGDRLLIEAQVPGENYRLLYLEGQLLDAVQRCAPSVTGDGRSSVLELVHAANAERRREGWQAAQVLLTVDLDMRRTLAGQGLGLRSVPPAGTAVRLKTVINENSGRENVGVVPRLCAEVIEAGRRAAEAVGTKLAGVDLITRDPGLPLEATGGVVLEVNTTPGYYYHYHQSGRPFRAAEPILRRLLASAGELPLPAPDLPEPPTNHPDPSSHASSDTTNEHALCL